MVAVLVKVRVVVEVGVNVRGRARVVLDVAVDVKLRAGRTRVVVDRSSQAAARVAAVRSIAVDIEIIWEEGDGCSSIYPHRPGETGTEIIHRKSMPS